MKPHVSSNAVFKNNATVVVADSKPLSLLATAGVLHHAGMRCVCARTIEAVLKACEIDVPAKLREPIPPGIAQPSTQDSDAQEKNVATMTNELIKLVEDASQSAGIRADQGAPGMPETAYPAHSSASQAATNSARTRDPSGTDSQAGTGKVDLVIWDVGDEAPEILEALALIRETHPDLPAILLADSQWAGLEKKVESLAASTRCLFKPIDPAALVSVAEPLLWMPALQSVHRNRGSRPSRPGWVTL